MYTYCTIRWVDDHALWDVIIKSTDEVDQHDDRIFFYGMSRDQILRAYRNHDLCENEWEIVGVGETVNRI